MSDERPEIVCVVGGGWSASAVDLHHLPGTVIGVNEPAILIRCDIALSMDRLWMEYRWKALKQKRLLAYARDAALKNIHERPEWLRSFGCDYRSMRFSETDGVLNGTNSGACALNLAYIMRPKRIYLFGFDMGRSPDGRAYWWGQGYPWARENGGTGNTRYAEWAKQFDRPALAFADAGIEVRNVSATSMIEAFARITPKQFRMET